MVSLQLHLQQAVQQVLQQLLGQQPLQVLRLVGLEVVG